MFDNIGNKIKLLAQIVCWIEMFISVICGIIFMIDDTDTLPIGIIIFLAGPLLAWVSSFILYGFGQLIENTDILVEQGKQKNVSHQPPRETREDRIRAILKWREQGLITQEEYKKKLESIVNEEK